MRSQTYLTTIVVIAYFKVLLTLIGILIRKFIAIINLSFNTFKNEKTTSTLISIYCVLYR